MVFEDLRPKPLQRISSAWGNKLVDVLEMLYGGVQSSVKYYDLEQLGYDIIPDQDFARKLGEPDRAWKELYAHYGYFENELYVQGKRVIKDEDPVNVYDIFQPAQDKIKTAIDQADYVRGLYGYVGTIKDRVVRLDIDEYGRLGIIVAEPIDEYGRVRISTEDAFKPVSTKDSIVAASNSSGLTVLLDTGGRPNVNIYYKLGGAGQVIVQVSTDGQTWRTLETITLDTAGEAIRIYQGLAYRFVRVVVPTTGIDVELEITASR